MENEHTRKYYQSIGIQQHTANRHICALIHHGSYNVGATCASIMHKRQSKTQTAKNAAYHHIHHRVVRRHDGSREQRLHYRNYRTQPKCTEYRAQYKPLTHNLICRKKRYNVQCKYNRTNRNAQRIVEQRCQTGVTANNHVLWQNKCTKTERIYH